VEGLDLFDTGLTSGVHQQRVGGEILR